MNRLEKISELYAKQSVELEFRTRPYTHDNEEYEGDWWSDGETFRISIKESPDDAYISSNAPYYNLSLPESFSKEFVLLHNAWPAIHKVIEAASNIECRYPIVDIGVWHRCYECDGCLMRKELEMLDHSFKLKETGDDEDG